MRYTSLGRGTGLRVSELALGGALFGTAWGYGAEPAEVARLVDRFVDAGGNFIDTADSYQFGQSEGILATLLPSRRDKLVLASKFTLGAEPQANVATTGNSRKNLVRSVEASLKRLNTDFIDLYWCHMPDGVTASDEIMRGLDDLVRSGKVLYVGLSDFPAWRVARAATLAELRGWAPVAAIQIEYSLVERGADRELLPMAAGLGLGVTAWSPLGGGLLSGKYRRGEAGRATTFGAVVHREDDARKTATVSALIDVAGALGVEPAAVALAWVRAKGVVPIIGPRTLDQLEGNLATVGLTLAPEHLDVLEQASAISLGFPHDFLAEGSQRERLAGGALDRFTSTWGPVA
jgi:aryl-alcohol dehydrogenase-like predicted oxidoreductase